MVEVGNARILELETVLIALFQLPILPVSQPRVSVWGAGGRRGYSGGAVVPRLSFDSRAGRKPAAGFVHRVFGSARLGKKGYVQWN